MVVICFHLINLYLTPATTFSIHITIAHTLKSTNIIISKQRVCDEYLDLLYIATF